jgi:creatinine amidohydrolase/Fe(II)-dependent formamide hydrolase-like protein
MPNFARVHAGLRRLLVTGALLAVLVPAFAAPSSSVYLEDLTWTELRDRITAGATTVLVPIGGTEQSGPHIALGKHNTRARVLAGRIAQRLGNAVVAPTMAYVPEGAIEPPTGHMRFAGTLSISDASFEAVLESTARSLRQHGFRDVVLLGDHGGYQKSLERVAAKLDREWAGRPGCKVIALVDYYRVTQTDFVDALRGQGFGNDEIGSHAGLADTALMLAIDPAMVREGALAQAAQAGPRAGVYGDPRRATAALGQVGVERIVERSVQAIRAATRVVH